MLIETRLKKAAENLAEITPENIADSFSIDESENYVQVLALIAKCREALAALENDLNDEMTRSFEWHRDCVAKYEALGVPSGAACATGASSATPLRKAKKRK